MHAAVEKSAHRTRALRRRCRPTERPTSWGETRESLETGIHLETVLPRVAHRQWTLSVPFSVRFAVVKKPKLLKRLEVR